MEISKYCIIHTIITESIFVDLNKFIKKLTKRMPAPALKPLKIMKEPSTASPPLNYPKWAVSSEWTAVSGSVCVIQWH